MQVDPIEPTLKPPGTGRLTLKYDELLSSFAFNSNLRRCIEGEEDDGDEGEDGGCAAVVSQILELLRLLSVRRCRLTLSNPR